MQKKVTESILDENLNCPNNAEKIIENQAHKYRHTVPL
jgi:hypothetical protein